MAKKKMSILDFKKYKEEGRKFTYVTAYDYTMASIINDSETEVILVGDSLGMIMLGYDGTEAVTMEDMIHHTKSVVKGAPDTYIIGDMPFGSYNESTQQAIHNCTRLMKETGCDAIKLEGGAKYAELIKAIINAGIPVCGHIGLTPQTTTSLGGFKVQGKNIDRAKKLVEPYKGKFVLLDIWGTWCGPCKEALSHSTEEYARLKDYDIQYLYLANQSPQNSWENVIKEYNVSGPNVAHYNLPQEQQSAIERHLDVHSFPTYKLFDRNGNLLDLKVDPRDLEGLARLLEQMK